MFEFTTPPEDIRIAEPWKDEPAFDIYWRSAGISANSYWIVNSSCDEWMGFRSEFVPHTDCRYAWDDKYEELVWLKKDELLQFISCASLCERLKVAVRTNRFTFAMDRETGEYCQSIREITSDFEIYMYDRGDMLVLWTFLSSGFDPGAAEATQNRVMNKEFQSRYGFSLTQYPLVIEKDGSLNTTLFCTKCNQIMEQEEIEYVVVNGECYDCRNASSE